jgi:hypothetical protein
MNKKGQGLPQVTVTEYIILIAVVASVFFMMSNALNTERYNTIRAEDLALSANAVLIPDGDISYTYDMGIETRNVFFENGKVITYIGDSTREKSSFVLIDDNYVFDFENKKVDSLVFSKEGSLVKVT